MLSPFTHPATRMPRLKEDLMTIITKAIGVALAATALCGLGVATASAAVPNTARHTANHWAIRRRSASTC